MPERRTSLSAITAASTALLFGLGALGATGCGDDRIAADAHRALGTQLGSAPRARGSALRVADNRQAASADDLMAARRYLEATLRLDPANAGARTALVGLGGPPPDETDVAAMDVAQMPGPIASRAGTGRRMAAITQVAFGEVGAFGADVAQAVTPWATIPNVRLPITRQAPDSTRSLTTIVASDPAPDSAARESAARVASRARARTRAAVARRHAAPEAETTLAARDDSSDTMGADSVRTVNVSAPQKHKRTWPWTRMQRWLVAKGVAGGAGAGVVVGAIVGNVPGAIIAGSLGGGALGFKKATKIGPAAPYPTPHDSAAFDAERRARDAEKRKADVDSTAKVAVAHP